MTAHQGEQPCLSESPAGKGGRTGGRNHSSSHPHQRWWAGGDFLGKPLACWARSVMLRQISGSSFGKPQKNTLQLLGGPVAEAPASGYVGAALPGPSGPLAGVSPSALSQPARPLTQEIRLAGRAAEGSFRGWCTQPHYVSSGCKTEQIWRPDKLVSSSDA